MNEMDGRAEKMPMMNGGLIDVSDPITKRLEQEKAKLEDRLKIVNDALRKLKDNPAVADVINSVGKVIHW